MPLIAQAYSNEDLTTFVANALCSAVSVPYLQKLNPHDMCVRFHAAAARLQLQWMYGLVTDVGFMRVVHLMLYFANGILNS